jgi:hypothetical protein
MNNQTPLKRKPDVLNYAILPLSDNIYGDIRKTIDTGNIYFWNSILNVGSLSDWELYINTAPESGDELAHTQNTDTKLLNESGEEIINNGNINHNITVENGKTVDGRDISEDGSKLDKLVYDPDLKCYIVPGEQV